MALTQADIDEIDISMDLNGTKNNVEIREAFQKILDGGSTSSSVYLAMLNQSGTNIPTAVEIVNSLGTITYLREEDGTYFVNSSGLFTSGKTVMTAYQGFSKSIKWEYDSPSSVQIFTYDDIGSIVDGVLDGIATFIKIEVYP